MSETPKQTNSGTTATPPLPGGERPRSQGTHLNLVKEPLGASKYPKEVRHFFPDPNSIGFLKGENLCEVKFTKSKEGFWTVSVLEKPDGLLTMRDRNEVLRQFKLWFRRRQRKIILDNHAKQREASEKEAS